MRKRIFLVLTIALFLFAGMPGAGICDTDTLVVGSFNIEWLGDSNKVRAQEDTEALARFIKAMEVGVFCFQEINPNGDKSGNGLPDWTDLLTALGPNYAARVGKTGVRQLLAILWNVDRVELFDFGELKGIERENVEETDKKTFPRVPFTAYVRSKNGGVDFRIITVHLYFGDDKARFGEAKRLKQWIDDYLAENSDKDVLLIGDFNTKPLDGESFNPQDSETITNLESSDGFTSVSKAHTEFTTPTSEERYDHAFLSKDLLEEEYIAGSWDVRREVADTFPDAYKKSISNHCPVTLKLRDLKNQDNDTEAAGDWGEE